MFSFKDLLELKQGHWALHSIIQSIGQSQYAVGAVQYAEFLFYSDYILYKIKFMNLYWLHIEISLAGKTLTC